MKFNTKAEVQSFVSGIRRELKDVKKPANQLSYNEVLTLLSRALDFKNWNAMEATLQGSTPAASVAPMVPKYPLVNKGQFDFVGEGETGELYTGDFRKIGGTIEVLQGAALLNTASREADGSLEFDYEGTTEVDWDSQESKLDSKGNYLWTDEDNDEMGSGPSILVPEDCYSPEDDEDLPVRDALLEAYREYFDEVQLVQRNLNDGLSKLCERAAKTIGYSLTENELKAFATLMGVAL